MGLCTALKMEEGHDLNHVAHAQAIGGRVKTDITGGHSLVEVIFRAWHDISQHSPPAQLFHKIRHAAKIGHSRHCAVKADMVFSR